MNELAVAVSIILFPGLIATVISDKITNHSRGWGSFKYSIYSFIFGVTCYVALQVVGWLLGMLQPYLQLLPSLSGYLDVWTIATNSHSKIDLFEVGAATIMSVPVAFFAAYLINHKTFNKIAKRISVSNKYGDENLFYYYLNADEIDWVYVRDFERKLTYEGRICSYSENDNIQEIVLSEVTVYGYEDSDEYYSVPSIYLCREMGRFVIEGVPTEILEEASGKETTK
ncbi:MAG: hypothetical protein IT392_12595 [Nitrospirae bacterium]|nr:hypothetical protein [Nitrospirota bacterium]